MSEPGTESEAASSAHSKHSKRSNSKRSNSKRAATVNDLVKKLHGRLGHEDSLSLTEHLSAAKVLCSIRNRLSNGETLDSKTLIVLLCSGIACHRRWSVGDSGIGGDATEGSARDEAKELKLNDESKELVRGTATRIFVLLCMSERQKKQTSDLQGARAAVATAGLTSVWTQIEPRPKRAKKKKACATEEGTDAAATADAQDAQDAQDAEDGDERREEPSWEVATRLTPGEVARHALTLGVNCLDDEVYTALDGLMSLFYRNASANMAGSMLMPSGDQDFVSLAMATPMNALKGEQRAKKLAALSMAAESEAGQSIMRDFLLSFLLPASHVGVRRTLLLTRASSTQAGVDYPELTTRAHEVACVFLRLELLGLGRGCIRTHSPTPNNQDGRLGVDLRQRHQRLGENVLHLCGAGRAHDEGRRRPHSKAGRLPRAVATAIPGNGAASAGGAAHHARAEPPALGAVPSRRARDAAHLVLVDGLRRFLRRGPAARRLSSLTTPCASAITPTAPNQWQEDQKRKPCRGS